MADRYVRSAFWLLTCTGVGYGLLAICTPTKQEIEVLKKKLPGVEKSPKEAAKKKQQFVDVLQAATNANQPLYRLNKEQIESELSSKK